MSPNKNKSRNIANLNQRKATAALLEKAVSELATEIRKLKEDIEALKRKTTKQRHTRKYKVAIYALLLLQFVLCVAVLWMSMRLCPPIISHLQVVKDEL